MITSVADLKGAFIACCARDKGLPLGRTAFQDFEIAYFLNMAYDKCVKARVDALAKANFDIGTGQTYPARDHRMGNILSELGELYAPQPQAMELSIGMALNDYRFRMWGRASHMFEIMPVNGAFPYVIGADLHEVAVQNRDEAIKALIQSKRLSDKTGIEGPRTNSLVADFFTEMSKDNITWPIRIIQGAEMMNYSLVFQQTLKSIERFPYRVGRIRTFMVESASTVTDAIIESLKNSINTFFRSVDKGSEAERAVNDLMTRYYRHKPITVLEIMHGKIHDVPDLYELFVSFETIKHPEVITESQIKQESTDKIEVNFGFEIAEAAAEIASRVLNADGTKAQPGI
jgi:hypothetical protein